MKKYISVFTIMRMPDCLHAGADALRRNPLEVQPRRTGDQAGIPYARRLLLPEGLGYPDGQLPQVSGHCKAVRAAHVRGVLPLFHDLHTARHAAAAQGRR